MILGTDMARILVVEDDAATRLAIGSALRAHGHEVSVAADGAGAIVTAQRQPPDLIVLDLGLPAGDGFVVMRRLTASTTTAGIPIVVLSARDPETHEARALEGGAVAYLRKPFAPDVLNAAVQKHLRRAVTVDAPTVLVVTGDPKIRSEVGRLLAGVDAALVFASDAVTAGSIALRARPRLVLMCAPDAAPVRRLQRTPQFADVPVAWLQTPGGAPGREDLLRQAADVLPTAMTRDAILARVHDACGTSPSSSEPG